MELRNFFKKNNSKNLAQNSCEFNQKNTPKNESDFEKKNNKFLKVFGCMALATFMTATALFATAPFGSGAASAATNTNLSNNTQTTSPLGLDPENDPVVYMTSSGLEIKYANALSNTNLNKCLYITMGKYNSYALNWIVIGYPKMPTENLTPAGQSINAELSKDAWIPKTSTYMTFFDELNVGEFIVISEAGLLSTQSYIVTSTSTTTTYYGGEINVGSWPGSYNAMLFNAGYVTGAPVVNNLQTDMNSLYTACSFTTAEKNVIKSHSIGNNNKFFGIKSNWLNFLPSNIAYQINSTTACKWWYEEATISGAKGTSAYERYVEVVSTSGQTENLILATSYPSAFSAGSYGGGSPGYHIRNIKSVTNAHTPVSNPAFLRPCMVIDLYDQQH